MQAVRGFRESGEDCWSNFKYFLVFVLFLGYGFCNAHHGFEFSESEVGFRNKNVSNSSFAQGTVLILQIRLKSHPYVQLDILGYPPSAVISVKRPWERFNSHSKLLTFCFVFFRLSLQELNDLRASGLKSFREIVVDESNILQWTGLIVPVSTVPEIILPRTFYGAYFILWSGTVANESQHSCWN